MQSVSIPTIRRCDAVPSMGIFTERSQSAMVTINSVCSRTKRTHFCFCAQQSDKVQLCSHCSRSTTLLPARFLAYSCVQLVLCYELHFQQRCVTVEWAMVSCWTSMQDKSDRIADEQHSFHAHSFMHSLTHSYSCT